MVKKKEDLSAEEKILEAARKVFMSKGLAGARMQDIADEAGINKALLHYYFRNKEKLFEVIFMEAAQTLFPRINFIFESDLPLFQKIEQFVEAYISGVMENPFLPIFLFNEMNQNPQTFFDTINNHVEFPKPTKLIKQIEEEIKKGIIKPINPLHLLLNMFSLCIFPFIAKPLFQMRVGIKDKQFRELMEQRKKEIPVFIIDSIKK